MEIGGYIKFNLEVGYNFWTVRDGDFTFGMHTQHTETLLNDTILTLTFILKLTILDFLATGDIKFWRARTNVRGAIVIAQVSVLDAWTKTLT